VSNHIIASNKDACLGAVKRLNSQREIADCEYLGSYWRGEADDLARNLAAMFCQFQSRSGNSHRPRAFVWGGEATVTVRGKGKGGRNGEEALAALETIAACRSRYATVAFFATDGIDGKTDSAGAIIDPLTLDKARNLKVDPKSFLQNNDSYTFFRKVGSSLIITGPSGTNVNDIGIAILRARTD
jgi:glycerate 2-kinase